MKNFAPDETLLVFDVIPPREYRGADAFRKDWQGFFDRFGPITIQNSEMNVTTSHSEMAFATYITHLAGNGVTQLTLPCASPMFCASPATNG